MNKVELSLIATLSLAILSGVYIIGQMDGRLAAIEKDKDYQSFKLEKENALSELKNQRISSVQQIQAETELAHNTIKSEKSEAIEKLSKLKKLNQNQCHTVDSSVNGGKLMCKVGEYVAGAQNLRGRNNTLDFIICCSA
ncbi:hypothetical protein ESZ36_20085 [Colwellia demingiae]|uniref:Uncharacterized protein n=1 Tax=Colwellia demingiae TaxID=89401 RepID=A0A5C6Q6Q6_9GAMM|nr:hypothetical protein [Colwellia demingiae]TWX64596.1 hypothetical protein ESZ36_20085 [Colwellia demingiae]